MQWFIIVFNVDILFLKLPKKLNKYNFQKMSQFLASLSTYWTLESACFLIVFLWCFLAANFVWCSSVGCWQAIDFQKLFYDWIALWNAFLFDPGRPNGLWRRKKSKSILKFSERTEQQKYYISMYQTETQNRISCLNLSTLIEIRLKIQLTWTWKWSKADRFGA